MDKGGLESSVNAVLDGDCGGGKGGAVSLDEESAFSVGDLLRLVGRRADGEEVAAGGALCGAFASGGGADFFAFLPPTCDQRGTTGGRVGFGAWMCGAAGAGPLSAGEVGFGVGVGDP